MIVWLVVVSFVTIQRAYHSHLTFNSFHSLTLSALSVAQPQTIYEVSEEKKKKNHLSILIKIAIALSLWWNSFVVDLLYIIIY
jgi:hypothetical protein